MGISLSSAATIKGVTFYQIEEKIRKTVRSWKWRCSLDKTDLRQAAIGVKAMPKSRVNLLQLAIMNGLHKLPHFIGVDVG